jgi:hypothetical protein
MGASKASPPIRQDEFAEHLAMSAAAAKSRVSDEDILPIEHIIREAWAVGQAIDLSNIGYGPAHWSGDKPFTTHPSRIISSWRVLFERRSARAFLRLEPTMADPRCFVGSGI